MSKAELNVSKDEFNSVDESGVPVYEYNDNWLKNLEDAYFLVLEKAEDELENVSNSKKESASEDLILQESKYKLESNLKLCGSLENQITSLTEGITSSIDAINKEVFNMADNSQSFNRVQSLKLDLNTLDNKIDEVLPRLFNQYASLLTKSEIEEKDTVRSEFCSREKGRISSILLSLSKKIIEPAATTPSTRSPSSSVFAEKPTTYLKKADPPKWEGDPLEFADFKRKWENQVSTANMTPEAELDRLRENIPKQAAKALFGETVMLNAWKMNW